MAETTKSIGDLVREQELNYTQGVTTLSKHVEFNMLETLDKVDAYLHSKHTTGEEDSMGREKPFFNLVTAAVNIWYRATDIDRSWIKIRATKVGDTTGAFLATVFIQDWMRKVNFGAFLNDWGRALARYGSTVIKFVEKEGDLIPMVVPWNRLIVDAVDFASNPVIEIIELTEAQLYSRVNTHGYDRGQVEALCEARQARRTVGGDKKDNLDNYIKLYEVHGELPLSLITGKESDDNKFGHQMHVVSFLETKDRERYDDYTLVSGREQKSPYMLTHLIKEDGQTLSIGAVQHLFEAQWMANHTVKAIKDQLDLASKLVFQTSDGNFVGQNYLQSIENGDILIHQANQPLTQVNMGAHDIVSLQNFHGMWKALGNEVVGISESMLGKTAPSGTPWRQVDALLQESHDLFELMTENKALHVEDMLRWHVIPHLKKKMDTTKEIVAVLEDHDITRIDKMFVRGSARRAVNNLIVEKVLNDEDPTKEDQSALQLEAESGVQEGLQSLGNIRFFSPSDVSDKTWKETFKDLEWDLEVDIQGESSSAKDDMVTLSTVFQTIADPSKAAVLQTAEGKFLFNTILNKAAGVSPLQLSSLPQAPATPPPAPVDPGASAPMMPPSIPAPVS